AKMIAQIYADGHRFTRQLFEEDGEICRRVQRGIEQAEPGRAAVLGDGIEARVAHFHRAYRQSVSA
ncbi:MAG: SRPBCC family protein, partial [Burkholderiaceae bacterium]